MCFRTKAEKKSVLYWNTYKIGGDTIDRIMILEVNGKSSKIFDEILTAVQKHSEIQRYDFKAQTSLILDGLQIDYDSRKVFCNGQEVVLTVKEYEMLCLLTAYRGRVLEYGQIYQNIWGEDYFDNSHNAVGCHIRNLRRKLYQLYPDAPFEIKCIREVGYCFEMKSEPTEI